MAHSNLSPEESLIKKEANDKHNRALTVKDSWLIQLFDRNKISPFHRQRILRELLQEHKQLSKAI